MAQTDTGVNPDPEPTNRKDFTPTKIVYDRLTTQFDYLPNTNLLGEIKKSTGYRYVFLYNEQKLIKEYQIYQGDKFVHFAQIARDATGKITKIVKFDVEPVYQQSYYPRGQYLIEFNSKNELTKILDYGADKKLIDEKALEYDDKGNIIKIHTDQAGTKSTANLSYDSENGIYRHIPHASLIFVLHKDIEMLGNRNNFIGYNDPSKTDEERSVKYDYNTDHYPSKMMVTRKKWKETHLITYTENPHPEQK